MDNDKQTFQRKDSQGLSSQKNCDYLQGNVLDHNNTVFVK